MAIQLKELDPDLPVNVHEQGRLQNVTVAQVTAVLGFRNNRFYGGKVSFDWGFTAQIDDDAEPAICAVYDWNGSAGETPWEEDDEGTASEDDASALPPAMPYFYTFGPDVVFQTLFGSAYVPTPALEVAADGEAATNRKMAFDTDHFCFGVWTVKPDADLVAQVKADRNVIAMSELEVRMLLAATQREFCAEGGYRSLGPDAYKLVERAAAIGMSKGLIYHPDPVPALLHGESYLLLHYHCARCAYLWYDYWTSLVDSDCPRCGAKHLMALPESREIATSDLPEWVNIYS